MRYLQLDGLRGVMLISMVLSHLGARLPLGATHNLVFKAALLNDAASAFVFLSGLTAGLVYTKAWIDPQYEYRKNALRRRALLVFQHHALLVIMVTAMAVLTIGGNNHWILEPYGSAPLLFGVLSLLMLAGGWCLDILPMYVLFLLLTPAALSAVAKGQRWIVIAFVILAWLMGQAGVLEWLWDTLELAFRLDTQNIDLGLNFNRLSWSALYFSGLLFGSAYVRGEFDLSFLKQPKFALVLLSCLVLIAGLMIVLLSYLSGSVTYAFPTFYWLASKHGFGFLAMLNFVAMTFVITWLLAVGPSSPYRSMQVLGNKLNHGLRWRPLVLLGQHSLGVFTFHIVGVYAFYLVVDPALLDPWSANLVLLAGVLSLAVPVCIGQAWKSRKIQVVAQEQAASA